MYNSILSYDHSSLFSSRYRNNWFYKQIKQVCPGKVCVDIGTGSGVLSLFAIHAGAEYVYMIDHDIRACTVAKNIFKRNNIPESKYTIIHALFDEQLTTQLSFIDVIISETITGNFFSSVYFNKICEVIKSSKSLQNAIIIPDEVYGTIMLYSKLDNFNLSNTSDVKIKTGVHDIDNHYEFEQDLLHGRAGGVSEDKRVLVQNSEELPVVLRDILDSKCNVFNDAIFFDAYNPFTNLSWTIKSNIANKTYGAMIIGRLACRKATGKKHPMHLDVWPLHCYRFTKTSDNITIHFNPEIDDLVLS